MENIDRDQAAADAYAAQTKAHLESMKDELVVLYPVPSATIISWKQDDMPMCFFTDDRALLHTIIDNNIIVCASAELFQFFLTAIGYPKQARGYILDEEYSQDTVQLTIDHVRDVLGIGNGLEAPTAYLMLAHGMTLGPADNG